MLCSQAEDLPSQLPLSNQVEVAIGTALLLSFFHFFFFFPPGVWLGSSMGLPQNRCCATIILALCTANEISAAFPRVSRELLKHPEHPAAGLVGGGSAATCFVCLSM